MGRLAATGLIRANTTCIAYPPSHSALPALFARIRPVCGVDTLVGIGQRYIETRVVFARMTCMQIEKLLKALANRRRLAIVDLLRPERSVPRSRPRSSCPFAQHPSTCRSSPRRTLSTTCRPGPSVSTVLPNPATS